MSPDKPNFNPLLDPKCDWAMKNLNLFPIDVNTADMQMILRVPGIGVRSAKRIQAARKVGSLDFAALKRIGVVLKRARYFLIIGGKYLDNVNMSEGFIMQNLIADRTGIPAFTDGYSQLSMFSGTDSDISLLPSYIQPNKALEVAKCLSGEF